MFFFQEPEVRSQLKAIGRAFLMLFGLAAGVAFLFFIFWWEIMLEEAFRETSPTEIAQTALLAATSGLFFLEAFRRAELRHALVLVGGFFGCMLIREQDHFLDVIQHGCWVYPALALAGACIAYACTNIRQAIFGLERFVRWKNFPFLLIGLVIVLAYSRLFGMGHFWKLLLGEGFSYTAKACMEESSELLGYLFIFISAVLANTDRHLR